MASASESELVRRAIAGDAAARSELWRAHREAVAAILFAHRTARLPKGEVEDLLQDVALRFCRHVGELREPDRFEPWLMQVARNAARESARRARARGTPRRLDETAEPAAAPDPAASGSTELIARLAELPEEYREVLVLRCVERLPQRRIAELLGTSEAAIEGRLARARRLLRERLARAEAVADVERFA